MNTKQQRVFNNRYYKKVLLQILGLEKEIFVHVNSSCKFYYNNESYILWTGANKLQHCKSGRWINNADKFIISNVLREQDVQTLSEFK